jgi:hypothetical protein
MLCGGVITVSTSAQMVLRTNDIFYPLFSAPTMEEIQYLTSEKAKQAIVFLIQLLKVVV